MDKITKDDVKNVENMIANLYYAIGGNSGFKQDIIVKWLDSYEKMRQNGYTSFGIVSDAIFFEGEIYCYDNVS